MDKLIEKRIIGIPVEYSNETNLYISFEVEGEP